MADLSGLNAYPAAGAATFTATTGETFTLDPDNAQLLQIYVDHASDPAEVSYDGGSTWVDLGTDANQGWVSIWAAHPNSGFRTSDVRVRSDSGSAGFYRVS